MPLISKTDKVRELISWITSPSFIALPIADKRESLTDKMRQLIDAQVGFWGWGRGMPMDSGIAPVASILVGFTPVQISGLHQMALSENAHELINKPVRELLRLNSHVSVMRSQFWTDEQWSRDERVKTSFRQFGWDDWLISVDYFRQDTWNSWTFFRALGASAFGEEDKQLVDLAMASISWLRPNVVDIVPASTFVDLSPRQRTVLMLLLEGLSRKQIAANLEITLHTVNDHCKALYARFGVNSQSELSARFLKSM
jgi:DNA-binding CsgD family transcriptional regulator